MFKHSAKSFVVVAILAASGCASFPQHDPALDNARLSRRNLRRMRAFGRPFSHRPLAPFVRPRTGVLTSRTERFPAMAIAITKTFAATTPRGSLEKCGREQAARNRNLAWGQHHSRHLGHGVVSRVMTLRCRIGLRCIVQPCQGALHAASTHCTLRCRSHAFERRDGATGQWRSRRRRSR